MGAISWSIGNGPTVSEIDLWHLSRVAFVDQSSFGLAVAAVSGSAVQVHCLERPLINDPFHLPSQIWAQFLRVLAAVFL